MSTMSTNHGTNHGTNHARIELPRPGHSPYYELPVDLQHQLDALDALDTALGCLESVERAGRELDTSSDPSERHEFRNRQRDSLDAYRLFQRLEVRAQLAYVHWLITRTEEEGDGARGPRLVVLRRLEIETDAKLSLLAQEA